MCSFFVNAATGQNQAKQQEKKKADINKEPESTKSMEQKQEFSVNFNRY